MKWPETKRSKTESLHGEGLAGLGGRLAGVEGRGIRRDAVEAQHAIHQILTYFHSDDVARGRIHHVAAVQLQLQRIFDNRFVVQELRSGHGAAGRHDIH